MYTIRVLLASRHTVSKYVSVLGQTLLQTKDRKSWLVLDGGTNLKTFFNGTDNPYPGIAVLEIFVRAKMECGGCSMAAWDSANGDWRETRGARWYFSWSGAHPGGTNLAPDGVIFRTAEKLGIEIGHCWSHIFYLSSKQDFLGCVLDTMPP